MTDNPFDLSLSDLTASDAVEVMELDLSDVREDPDQPRDDLDTEQAQIALAELAGTIKARGVLQPITVRPRNGSGKWIIRFGHRRYRASVMAGRSTIPAIERPDSAEDDDLYDQVIENEQRADLTALQMARFVRKALDRGQKPAEIARRLGKPKSKVSELIAIGDLAPELEAHVSDLGSRTLAELHAAHKIDAGATLAFVQANAADGGITQAAARAFAASLKSPAAPEIVPTVQPSPVHSAPPVQPQPDPNATEKPAERPVAPSPAHERPQASQAAAGAPEPGFVPSKAPASSKGANPAPASSGKPSSPPQGSAVDARTHAALTRLFLIAAGESADASPVGQFLLACWDAETYGGFHVADLFSISQPLARDIANVIEFFVEQDEAVYFDGLGFRAEIDGLVARAGGTE